MCTENIQAKMSPAVTTNEDAHFCAYSQILVYMASCNHVSIVLDEFSMSILMSAYSSMVILSDTDYFILRSTKKIRYAALGIPNA